MQHNYFVYTLTNYQKNVLYTGVTNDIERRFFEHKERKNSNSFTSKYKCFYLLYYERFQHIDHAIEREKEIKGWKRIKKEKLINELNPSWNFINDDIK